MGEKYCCRPVSKYVEGSKETMKDLIKAARANIPLRNEEKAINNK